MYRFALRPAWLLSHVLVFLLIVTLANLGLWQLRRLDERQDRNALIEARADQTPVPIEELLDQEPDDVRFRRVTVTGTFIEGSTVAIDNRTLDGRPGAWVLDPVVLETGETIVVNRGFVPFTDGIEIDPPPVPLGDGAFFDGSFEGTLEPAAGRSCAAVDRDEPDIASRYACVDLGQIAADLGLGTVAPFEVRASEPVLAGDAYFGSPEPVPLPDLGNGRHLAYAIQWFIFMTIAIVGYPLVLRRVAHQKDLPDAIDRELEELLDASG